MNVHENALNPPPEHASGAGPAPARRRGPIARLLRAIAGGTAAVRATRRGSFLVLVVGTLALMSVFAVVYIAIGRADTGAGVGVKRNAVRDNVPNQFADWVRKVVSDDMFDLAPAGEDIDSKTSLAAQLLRRETWDTPGHDPRATLADFSASGHGFDPWLGSAMPVALHYVPNTDEYLQYKDWEHLTCFAPDGMPVNLFNLRGNFDATPHQMRQNLSLLDKTGKPTTTTDYGQAVPAYNPGQPATVFPWYYWERQQSAFRPTSPTDPVKAWGAAGPDQATYPPYQYASPDGSGMFSGRWIELVEARDNNPDDVKHLLNTPNSLYRYFFSARTIDLSGLVNVSTAGDLRQAPSDKDPVGLTPADIDLRRLLALTDSTHQVGSPTGWKMVKDGSYQDFVQPQPPNDKVPYNYKDYNQSNGAVQVGDWAYKALREALTEGYIPKAGANLSWTNPYFPDAKSRADFFTTYAGFESSIVKGSANYQVGAIFSADDLLDLFAYRASNNPDITSSIERIFGGRYNAAGGPVTTGNFSALRDNRPLSVERDPRAAITYTTLKDPANVKPMFGLYADTRQLLTPASTARPLRTTLVSTGMGDFSNALSASEMKVSPTAGPLVTFPVYADALIPYSQKNNQRESGTWFGETDYNKVRTQNYGYISAEIGLQMAANMAVNLNQMLTGGEPTPYTVLCSEEYRATLDADWNQKPTKANGFVGRLPKPIQSRTIKNAWWVEGQNSGVATALDIGQRDPANIAFSRLATTAQNSAPTAQAFNVFGVHPEPVMSAVATFALYIDAPTSATNVVPGPGPHSTFSADVDGKGDPSNGDPGTEVTICGTIQNTNVDFVVEIVAFQLTNPYDSPINLNATVAGNDSAYDYYFEFANRYYRVGEVTRATPSAPLMPVTLEPGETRIFFATNESLNVAAQRLQNAARDPQSGTSLFTTLPQAQAKIEAFIDLQFPTFDKVGTGTDVKVNPARKPVWIEPFSTTLGDTKAIKNGTRNAYTDTTFFDIVKSADTDPTSIRVARLWRAMRSTKTQLMNTYGEMHDPAKPTAPMPEQVLENDLLVDRIHDSATGASLDCRIANVGGGNRKISGTHGFDEQVTSIGDTANDNTGLTVARYGLLRRPADPQSTTGIPAGAAPAYMFEARFGTNFNGLAGGANRNTLNKKFFDDRGPENDDPIKFLNHSAAANPNDFMRDLANPGFGGGQPTHYVLPFGGTGSKFGAFGDAPSTWGPASAGGTTFAVKPSITGERRPMLPGKIDKDAFRLGDALLPLAIGPIQFVSLTDANNAEKIPDQHWITTGEMLALATGWDRIVQNPTRPELKTFAPLYFNFGPAAGAVVAGVDTTAKTDRGQLALDKFVPFYRNNSAWPTSGLPVMNLTSGDYRRGLGIPAGLAVLDGFVAPAISKYGSLSRGIPGQINIATAPAPVLRAVPMLSPTPETGAWWWTSSAWGVKSDIAATLAGYRDKVEVPFRASSAVGSGAFADATADFRDSNGVKPNDLQGLDGRSQTNGVDGVREVPGIHTVGELMLAFRSNPNGTPPRPPDDNSIDNLSRIADSGGANHLKGVDSMTYDGQLTKASQTYAQMLAIATGALNTVTNRSDLFGVWFEVAGFQRSDVENLQPTDPMVPSVHRRFFMVLDRSEVVKRGQLPRIVLMRELPM